ncbi:MAG: PKD domain-containing protein [Candidatus Promineifilaceae bacterium]
MIRRIPVTLMILGTAVVSLTAVFLFCFRSAEIATSGSLRFVNEANTPLANAELRLLCYETNNIGQPIDIPAFTKNDGTLTHDLPDSCQYLAALWLRHTQPSGKPQHGPAYRIYATSWLPGSSTLQPAAGDIKLYDSRPLVLFDIVATLAWEPAPDSSYLSELRSGLQQASSYLYDLTEGQMAFGEVQIMTNGRNWQGADLRFLTANDYRPTAYMGGIVPAATPYTAPATLSETVYVPGAIYLGRYWDGLDATDPVDGAWNTQNAARTLAHEWGHYALFLYDEYQQSNSGGRMETYCTCINLPGGGCSASAMAYHYTAVALWHEMEDGLPAVCEDTDQFHVHGEADWDTLLRWSDIQNISGTWLQPPSLPLVSQSPGIAGDLFGQTPGFRRFLPTVYQNGTAAASPTESTLTLALDGVFSQATLNAVNPQVYLVDPLQAQYQGTTNDVRPTPAQVGQIKLLGVTSSDRARIYAERFTTASSTGGRFVYPAPGGSDLPVTQSGTLTLGAATWGASLDVSYGMDGPLLRTMTVTLTSPTTLSVPPIAQRCSPEASVGCSDTPQWRQTMANSGANKWTAVFNAPANSSLEKYGLLQVNTPEKGDLWRWFQSLGGVGPAYDDGEAPLLDGLAMAAAATAVPGAENQVMMMPAASYDALLAPLPTGFTAVVGLPLDLDVIVPTPNASLVFTLFYSQAAVDRVGVDETQLELLHYSRTLNQWQVVGVSGRSTLMNWVASVPVTEDGIYALGWRPVPPPLANFDALPLSGPPPLLVNFINLTEGEYTSSLWNFGDGMSSTETNPSHIYQTPGLYTVTLTVSGPGGKDTLIVPDFITVGTLD